MCKCALENPFANNRGHCRDVELLIGPGKAADCCVSYTCYTGCCEASLDKEARQAWEAAKKAKQMENLKKMRLGPTACNHCLA